MSPTIEVRSDTGQLAEHIVQSRIFNAQPDESNLHHEARRATDLAEQHPEIVQIFIERHVDCLSGSTSFSIDPVLEHGLVPTGLIDRLGLIALGVEHSSQPYARKGLHVVPWTRAGETIRYAERRVDPRLTYEYVTPNNADELAALDTSAYKSLATTMTGAHMLGVIGEARLFVANREKYAQKPFYPIVYGIDSSKIPTSTPVKSVDSAIRGDSEITGIVPSEAVTIIFAPQNRTDKLRQQLAVSRPDIAIESLEALRMLDADMYGWMMPNYKSS